MARLSIFKIAAAILFCVLININAQENYIVRNISFLGNDSLSADNLLEQMEFFETGWFADNLLFEDPFLFSEEIFQKDKIRIIRYYQREGFINANIDDIEFDMDNEDETIDIKIFVNEHKPVMVDTVNLALGDSIDQSLVKLIKDDLSLKAGIRFRDQQINEDKLTIINQFANRGYPYTKVNYKLYLDTSKTTVGIDWNIELGKRSNFGEVIIEGNNRSDKEIIRNQVSFENGDLYDSRELNKTQRQIYGLGIFYIVTVTPNLEEKPSNIPINIKIEELPRFNTEIGVGYGREEKFRISLDQKWLGFLGGARQLQFYTKYSALTPYHVRLNFIQPNFVVQETKFSISPFVIRQTEPGFTINRIGTDLTLQRPLFLILSAH
ncbi:MAG: POTRA domain-containing protein [Melioribacteraceae bacterium]|nr:POTRA domain-containing protein [Melioribacteraceae bacterium]